MKDEEWFWNEKFNYESMLMRLTYDAILDIHTAPHVVLKPKIYKDGNEWCVLLGDDIMEGICGFGKSPKAACEAFDKAWKEELLS